MQNEISYNSYCLDASCFSSLEKLKDTLNLLNTLKTYSDRMVLNNPKQVYDIIILPPYDKFRELPTGIGEWIDDEDEKRISSLDTRARQEYVQIVQMILNTFEIRHPSFSRILLVTMVGMNQIMYLNMQILYLNPQEQNF